VKGRKDGIPIPNLESFMMGYNKLLKMDIPSKKKIDISPSTFRLGQTNINI
jgi:hypothetical protein